MGNQRTMSGIVDKVSEKRMNKGFAPSSLNALSGQAAGAVHFTEQNRAAALSAVRVRNDFADRRNDPLVIIDGVSSDLNTLSSIYPADIKSFTILKRDASETAQYGSRGASGVIRGEARTKGKAALSVSVTMAVSGWRLSIRI